MSPRPLNFRCWDTEDKKWTDFETFIGSQYVGLHDKFENVIVTQDTGLTDINGQEIFEGDILVLYPSNYQTTPLSENIREVRPDLPKLPMKDVILNKGVVVYEAPSFRMKHTLGNDRIASSLLAVGENYEVVGNIYQNN